MLIIGLGMKVRATHHTYSFFGGTKLPIDLILISAKMHRIPQQPAMLNNGRFACKKRRRLQKAWLVKENGITMTVNPPVRLLFRGTVF